MNLEPRKRSGWNKLAAWGAGTLLLIILLSWAASCDNHAKVNPRGSGGVNGLPVPTHTLDPGTQSIPTLLPPAEVLPTDTPLSAPSETDTVTEGTYEVGDEITPGKYKSTGTKPGGFICYWARLRGDDETHDVITNHAADGPTTVVIKPGDKYFTTQGCADWAKQAG